MYSGTSGAPGAAVKFQVHLFPKVGKTGKILLVYSLNIIFLYTLFYVREIRKVFISKTASKTRKEKLKLKYSISFHMVIYLHQH